MRRFFALAFLCCFILSVSVLAVEDEAVTDSDSSTTQESVIPDDIVLPDESAVVDAPTVFLLPSENESNGVQYSTSALDESSAVDGDTMSAVVTAIFGEYKPRTQTVTDYLSDGTAVTSQQVVPGLAGLDWPWIAGVSLFALVLFSFLKLVGVFLKNG